MSTSTTSTFLATAPETASKATAEGSAPSRCLTTSQPTRSAQMESCSMAAARNVSAATSMTDRPSFLNRCAAFPMVVVFPTPLTPTTMMTLGSPGPGSELASSGSLRKESISSFRAPLSFSASKG